MADNSARRRVFLSYKRDTQPDEPIALHVHQQLGAQHDVFIDQDMAIGERWAKRIQDQLRASDFLIVFLSAESVHSEMVRGEIELAHRFYHEQGHPQILPVRLAYQEPFEYPLSAYLNEINWALWRGEAETPALIADLNRAICGASLPVNPQSPLQRADNGSAEAIPLPLSSAQPLPRLEMPEGTMDPQSTFYVERPSDQQALSAITRPNGVTLTIKGPRQMGKSSLLMKTMARAAEAGKTVVFLDFQLFDDATLGNADRFFRQFCTWLTDELELEDKVDEYWNRPLGNSQLCTRYVGRYLLNEVGAPLVLALDEVESIYDTEFRSDFFSMLRSWHNERAHKANWKLLDLALVTSTEPYQLIENLNQSPFNVGEIVELTDFSRPQVEEVNRKHGSPLDAEGVDAIIELLAGHPYLTRKALYFVGNQRLTIDDLLRRAVDDRGPFGDHLRYHLFRLQGQQELISGFKQILKYRGAPDDSIVWRLHGAGLVRREAGSVLPRCNLYAEYFKRAFNV